MLTNISGYSDASHDDVDAWLHNDSNAGYSLMMKSKFVLPPVLLQKTIVMVK